MEAGEVFGGIGELDVHGLRARFRRQRDWEPVVGDGHAPARPPTPAAVLVPLTVRPDALNVLLTRRTDHLHNHPGQISFPGGRAEPGDTAPAMTALREAQEEIGLDPRHVEVLGALPDYLTGTGFLVTPVVGLVHPPFELVLDPFEVAEAFEVPLSHFLDPARHERYAREFEGRLRHYYAMPYGERFIWGATAGMLVSLYRFLRDDD